MVSTDDIKNAIVDALTSAKIRTFSERVRKSGGPFAYVELSETMIPMGERLSRRILADITYVSESQDRMAEWYAVFDSIDAAVRPYIKVGGRRLTVKSAEGGFLKGEGHYRFILEFFDADTVQASGEIMEKIYLK